MSKPDLVAREAAVATTREQLMTTLQALQRRFSPKTITDDFKDAAKEKVDGAINAAKDGMVQAATHPSTVAAVTVPVLVYLFRKPIAQGLSAVFGHDKPSKGETPAPALKE